LGGSFSEAIGTM